MISIEVVFAYLLAIGLAGMMLATPWLSRRSTWFAVTVAEDFPESPTGLLISRRYRFATLGSLVLALALITPMWWLLEHELAVGLAILASSLIVVLGAMVGFVHCRNLALAHRRDDQASMQVTLAPPDRLADILPRPYWLHGLPYLVLAIPVVWLLVNWAQIPDPVILPGGADEAARPRQLTTVFLLPLVMLITLFMMHAVMPLGLMIRRLPGHVSRVRTINQMLLWMMVPTAVLGGWNSLGVLYGQQWIEGPAALMVNGLALLALLGVPVVMLLTGRFSRPGQPQEGDRSPDLCWKLGMFYFNPADPAVWVEKRFGVGYTLNFARPAAWIIMFLLIVPMPLLLIWLV